MILRKARISDLNCIMEVEKSSFIPQIQEESSVFSERIRLCGDLFLVFENEGKVCGYCSAEIMEKLPQSADELKLGHSPKALNAEENLKGYIYISSFALLPQNRGCGFGKKMWNESLEYFHKIFPALNFILLVNEEWKGAVHIYSSSGFEQVKVFEDFFPSNVQKHSNGILMIKNHF